MPLLLLCNHMVIVLVFSMISVGWTLSMLLFSVSFTHTICTSIHILIIVLIKAILPRPLQMLEILFQVLEVLKPSSNWNLESPTVEYSRSFRPDTFFILHSPRNCCSVERCHTMRTEMRRFRFKNRFLHAFISPPIKRLSQNETEFLRTFSTHYLTWHFFVLFFHLPPSHQADLVAIAWIRTFCSQTRNAEVLSPFK